MATNSFRSRVTRLESATDDDAFLSVIIRNFTNNLPTQARIGGNDGVALSQRAGESLDEFEARAIVAAREAGDRFVAINVYEPLTNVA
jgi:hypothetical protein